METTILPNSNLKSLTETLVSLREKIARHTIHTIKLIKVSAKKASRCIANATHPHHSYHAINIEHLHNTCQKLDNSSRKVFFLYVKGFSLDEISSLSGTHHDNIIPTVHNIVNDMHNNKPSAQA